jgi:tetratricopeptide (TPR) repeat protein
VNAYLGLGNLFAKKKGEEEKAIEWYLKCLEVSPSSVPVHNGLGRVYAITEKYDDAIKCFQKCISLN